MRLSHLCLNVTNLTASKNFYCNTLGLQCTGDDNRTSRKRSLWRKP
ncbi:VOC family protein [Roseobacter sp. EG26]